MTQSDIQDPAHITKTKSIGMGNYPKDSHTVANFVNPDNVSYHFDSNAAVPASMLRVPKPYQIPLEAFLPRAAECTNLVFLCAASFSHIAFSSYRIVKTWMQVGEAMGTITGLAASLSTTIGALDYASQITPALSAAGIVTSYTPS